jgi:hypothetical protein
MIRHLPIACFILAFSHASASAADNSSGASAVVYAGGLMCFSVSATRDGPPSCDAVCKAKGAACVGMKTDGAMDPGTGCDDASLPEQAGYYVVSCRCCAVER